MKEKETAATQYIHFEKMADMIPLILERFAEGKSVEIAPRGISMLPMLRQRKDTVILSAPHRRLKKYDVILYKARRTDAYVLHRIVGVKDGKYVCLGDNQFLRDKGVTDADVIAVLTAFKRGDKLITATSFGYCLYARFWNFTRPVRYYYYRIKYKLRSIFKRK